MEATDWRDMDELFDSVYDRFGEAPGVNFFDRRAYVPLDEIRDRLTKHAGLRLGEQEVADVIDKGWVSAGPLVYDPGRQGVPMYAIPRISLLIELREGGYSERELLDVAREDEELIEDLATFGFEYDDNDPSVVAHAIEREIREVSRRLHWVEEALRNPPPVIEGGYRAEHLVTPETVGDLRERLQHLRVRRDKWAAWSAVPHERWTDEAQREMAKAAFAVRQQDERTRFFLWQWNREQILEGFSPLIEVDDVAFLEPTVDWEATLKSPRYLARPQPVRLRVPGAVLEGVRVTSSRALTPQGYKELYERWDLDEYFRVLAEVTNRRICINCLRPLEPDRDPRTKYCDDRCRNAAKGRAWRNKNPRRAEEHQRRYYSSLSEPDLDPPVEEQGGERAPEPRTGSQAPLYDGQGPVAW